MESAKRLNGIGEYYFSQKLREIDALNKQGKDIINLGIGSPDLPPHTSVIETLSNVSIQVNAHAYQSYKGSPVLRNAIAKWYATWYQTILNPDTDILPLIGSKEGIMHICMSFINEGDQVLVPNPGYPTYRSAVQLAGGKCVDYNLLPENDFEINWDELNVFPKGTFKLMFVNYPQMPTGKNATTETFKKIITYAKEKELLIVHDNPYSFILNENPQSIMSYEGAQDVAIELNSLSKSHNMAGWRIGMLLGNEKYINEVLKFKSNMDSGMFLPIQMAAAKALELGIDWFESLNNIYQSRKEKAKEILQLLNCTYNENQVGLFLWGAIPENASDAFVFCDNILYNCNVFITPGGIFGSNGNRFVRISLCSDLEKLEKAIHSINEFQRNNKSIDKHEQ